MATKKLHGAQLKKAKSDLARLKKLGLYKGDARKQPTRYALRQIKEYKDVLDKRAKVVTVPKRKHAREYTEVFRTKYRKVVIPARSGEKFFYNKKSGEIFSYNREYGHRIKRIFPKHRVTADNVKDLPKGKNIRFAIPIGKPGHRERFLTFEDLAQFMGSYERYKDWQKYVEIEEILDDEIEDEENDE